VISLDHLQNHQKSRETTNPRDDNLEEQFHHPEGTSKQFLVDLLALQCALSKADTGAILRNNKERADILALYPTPQEGLAAPAWLKQAAEFAREAVKTDMPMIKPCRELSSNRANNSYILFVPFKVFYDGEAIEAFVIKADNKNDLEISQKRLQLALNLLNTAGETLSLQKKNSNLIRLQRAMESLVAVNRHDRLKSAAMTFCNELASQWQCQRVSIGFLKGRYVQLKALSHNENFTRKMRLIQDIESAMEECLDQDYEILYPASSEAAYISRAAAVLATRHGPSNILSLPLRSDGQVQGVLTLERSTDKCFNIEDIEAIRLSCGLCTPKLLNLHEHDRWIGARAAAKLHQALKVLAGPEKTWAKVLAIIGFAVIFFLVFAKGEFRVESAFVLEATYQQTICAPFGGFINAVNVEVGDTVKKDETILAELDKAELRLQLAAAKAERAGYLKQVAASMRDGQTAKAQIAGADADKVEAQIELLNYMIGQASIISPISGTVVKGDLKRQIGAPVKIGDALFEVTPLESLRAELLVPEDEIFDIAVGQQGYLATASYPGQRIKFVVERINPAAEIANNRNIFKVRARLNETRQWMRPGMEGIAKVNIQKRRYVWIWTRKINNWLRMKLWL
jgi:multidrug resistance efflux pump